MAIFDCFQYFNEDHIADLRFNILNEFVDKFIIVESTVNHQGKTIGEIFGVNSLDFPTISIFLLIPILTIVAVLITDFLFKNKSRNKTLDIDSLIKEMEDLCSKA